MIELHSRGQSGEFRNFLVHCWVGEVRVLHSDLPCYVEPWGGFVAISRSTTRPLQRFETRKIEGVLLTQIQNPSRWHSDIVEKYRGELLSFIALQNCPKFQRMIFADGVMTMARQGQNGLFLVAVLPQGKKDVISTFRTEESEG